jgi:hypothetical protein
MAGLFYCVPSMFDSSKVKKRTAWILDGREDDIFKHAWLQPRFLAKKRTRVNPRVQTC